MHLQVIVEALAEGIKLADSAEPIAVSTRTQVAYKPGIGPHTESRTIGLALDALQGARPFDYETEVPYRDGSRARCDLVLTAPERWAVEMKMLRLMGDNGKPNDNMLMHILSPYPAHRSALTDFVKLRGSGLSGRKAILVFGYDHPALPMDPAIDALDLLAESCVQIVDRAVAQFDGLIHPTFTHGRVFGWEIGARDRDPAS